MFKKIKRTHHHMIDENGNVLNTMTNKILKVWVNVQTGYP